MKKTQAESAVQPPLKITLDKNKEAGKTVMIGAHFPPQIRRALLLVQAHPDNEGKLTKELLGEAINDLCAKYGVPEPYREGESHLGWARKKETP